MTAIVYIASCAMFMVAALVTGVIALARDQIARIADVAQALGDKGLSDEEKERIARQGGLLALTSFLKLIAVILIVVVATAIPAVIAEWLNWTSAQAVWDYALRGDVLVITMLVVAAVIALDRYRRRT